MKAPVYFRENVFPNLPDSLGELLPDLLPRSEIKYETGQMCAAPCSIAESPGMGLGAGGRMKQEIYEDPSDLNVWDTSDFSRCFVHLCNALVWREITGTNPPQPPVTAREYKEHGLPWFDFYRDDLAVLEGSKKLAGVKSVVSVSQQKQDQASIENAPVETGSPVDCGASRMPPNRAVS